MIPTSTHPATGAKAAWPAPMVVVGIADDALAANANAVFVGRLASRTGVPVGVYWGRLASAAESKFGDKLVTGQG